MKNSIHRLLVLLITLLMASFVPVEVTEAAQSFTAPEEREDWMGTYFKGKKLGFTHVKMRSSPESIIINSKVYFRFRSQSINQVTSFVQETRLDSEYRLLSFSLLQEIMGHRQTVEGRTHQGKLTYRVTSLGYEKDTTISFPPEVAPSSTFLLNIIREGLQVGKKGKIPLFVEPFQMRVSLEYKILRKEEFEYEGRKVDTFVIFTRFSGIESTLWVTKDGSVMRELTAQGFESRKEPEHVARNLGDEAITISGMITLSLVKPEKEIVDSGKKRRLKLKLSQIPSSSRIPEDHRQKVLASVREPDGTYAVTLQVQTEPEKVKQPTAFPVRGFNGSEWLEDSAEVQSKHPQIRALARELSKNQSDSWETALNINNWVNKNLEKALVDSVTALDALRDRRGECQSHTYLFTALARAVGIPTKIVTGLVYSSQFKGFLYHAWPEVYVGEWRALDPTFGQDHVDATHIKLSEGAQEGPFQLLPFVGKVQLKVIDN